MATFIVIRANGVREIVTTENRGAALELELERELKSTGLEMLVLDGTWTMFVQETAAGEAMGLNIRATDFYLTTRRPGRPRLIHGDVGVVRNEDCRPS